MQRNNICQVDVYAPHTSLLNMLNLMLGSYEMCAFPPARRRALDRVYRMICEEDENTSYQALGPVNKMMNLVCRALVEGSESVAYRMHQLKRKDFMWIGPEGMRMCGTNGSQLWDIVNSSLDVTDVNADLVLGIYLSGSSRIWPRRGRRESGSLYQSPRMA